VPQWVVVEISKALGHQPENFFTTTLWGTIDNFKGKNTGVLFFLDKNVDDLLRKQRRSEHVVYTQYIEKFSLCPRAVSR
jgi:hypothetical protein